MRRAGLLRGSAFKAALAVFFTLFFTAAFLRASFAEDKPTADKPIIDRLTLYDAWRLALKYHEAVAISEESLTRSALDVDRARSLLLPDLTVESTYTRYTGKKDNSGFIVQPEDSSRVEVRLAQPIYNGGKEWSGLRQARKYRLSAQKGVEDARESVIMEASAAYYGLLKAREELKIQEASKKRAEEQLRVSRARFDVGSGTKAEVLRSEAEVARKTAEVVRAGGGVKDAEDVLRRITGVEGPFELSSEASGEEPGFTKDVDVANLVALALGKRKDYQQKLIAEEIAKEGINYAKGSFYPSLHLEGVYAFRDQTPQTSFFLDESAYAELIFSFPVFEGGLKRAELSQARSRLRQAELERMGKRREVELEVRRSYNNMETARSVIEAYRKEAGSAEENYSVVFKQYSYGLASATELVDAETTLVLAQMSLSSGVYDYILSVLEIKRNAGVLLEEAEKTLSARE